jgi:hypothetical protein
VAPPDNTAASSTVDAQHPWLGLDSFTEETRAYFYGRDEEVAELARRVQRKLLTILFGQSGLGKTSILRAGIVPRLRPMGYCPVYVRIDYAPDTPPPSEQIKAAIYRATLASGQWTQSGVAAEGESLWEFLHHRDDVLRDASGRTLIPLLIFDQFEEIFTLAQTDEQGRARAAEFIADLADLVENRPPKALEERIERDEAAAERFDFARGDYRILIALREDYLAHLEGLKAAMPSITQNRMRLARMTGAQALAAVVNPGGKLVSQEVAESIVRFTGGGAELRNAEVEPSLLSLICRELNNARIAQGRSEISADLLAGSRDTILAEFYERALADQPAGVRTFIEDEMLTESGFRESLAEERVLKGFAAAGAPPGTLAKLVNRRLLRIEERLDQRRVELTHDVLCPVVRASRDVRYEREARDEAERQLEAQRVREAATRRALVRARQIAAGCAVLAIVAVAGTIFGYVSAKRAQQAEAEAKQTRALAEAARGEAEKLIVYLLDDFYLELEPVGRLDIVAALSKRAIDYYAALPPELQTQETQRNRALAQVRYGLVLRYQSRLDEADKALSEAIPVLAKLHREGDASEATTIGLAMGLTAQGRVLDSRNKRSEAKGKAQEAVNTIAPLATAANPSVSVRRAYSISAIFLGYMQNNTNDEAAAVKTLDAAREALRSIDGLKLGDLPAAAAYAEASGWEVNALQALGRDDETRRVAEDGIRVAGEVLEKRPGHMPALRARALLLDSLAGTEAQDLHNRKALPLSQQANRDWQTYLSLDPGNQIAWNNLSATHMTWAFAHWNLGETRESAAHWRAALAVEPKAKAVGFIAFAMATSAGYLAGQEADAGNREAAADALQSNDRLIDVAIRDLPPDSYGRSILPERLRYYGFVITGVGYGAYGVPLAAGNWEELRKLAKASAQRLEQIKPPDADRELDRSRMLRLAYRAQAEASYRLKDYAAAEAEIGRARELGRKIPMRTLTEKRDDAVEVMQAAAVAARLGKTAEAQALIEPVLKLERDLYARADNDDQVQRVEYAQTLYIASLAGLGKKQAQLAEAAAVLDALSPETRGLVSTRRLRAEIAAEQGARR